MLKLISRAMKLRPFFESGNLKLVNRVLKLLLISVLFLPDTHAQPAYFQQQLDYRIQVSLDDSLDVLKGNLNLTYRNNSPDTLHFIWMHLWPNAYRDKNTALCKQQVENGSAKLLFADDKNRGYIDSISFTANNRKLKIEYDSVHSDICRIFLNEPLVPGGETNLKTPFLVKIPDCRYSRMGKNGDAFYISQWYPKPAVYDRNGWHPMPYLDQGEFYSEFGNFEVAITLPVNYVVASTGVLQEEREKQWLKEKSSASAEMHSYAQKDSFPPSSSEWKTITFRQDSIHDFAWFADKRFYVIADELTEPETGKKVNTWVYFTGKKADIWTKTPGILRQSIQFLSEEVGAYPYSDFSVVDGTISAGGGMEYPMITIINSPSDAKIFELTVFHELCHNWFYGMLANNERTDGWMDEGITTYYELKYSEKFLNGKTPGNNNLSGSTGFLGNITGFNRLNSAEVLNLTYHFSAFNNSDQPVKTASEEFTSINYGTVMYTKTAITFNFLNDYLGDSLFRNCMRNYFQNWKFRHPGPEDIKTSFEATSGTDLSWFFDDLLSTSKPVTYKISKTGGEPLLVTNKSGIAVPMKWEDDNGNSSWVKGFKDTASVINPFPESKFIYLNKDYTSLFKSCDLPYRTTNLRKKMPSVRLKPFYQVQDEPGTETLYLLPAVGWNYYNKWMAGIHLSNMDLIPESFEFYAVPLYDFKNNAITGLAGFDYTHWPLTGAFSEVKFSLRGKRFAFAENTSTDIEFRDQQPVFFYSKLAPGVNFVLRKKNARSAITQSFGYRNISTWLDEVEYTPVDSTYLKSYTKTLLNFNEITWQFRNDRTIDPFNMFFRAEQGKEHVKLAMEFNYRFSYRKKNKGIDVRLFAGGFVLNKTTDRNYNFRMSGWDGSKDYLYDETFFARNEDEGFWSRQFLVRDGGFKIPTSVGQTNQWLAAVNISADLPFPLPVKFFFDLGTYEGITTTFEDINSRFMFDGGIAIVPVKDVLEIYIPLFRSEDISTEQETNNLKFADQIRFVFNLNKLAPPNLRNETIKSF